MDGCPAVTETEWSVWRAVSTMQRRLEASVEARLNDASVSGPDFEVLSVLADRGSAPLRAGELAMFLGWEKSRLSHQLRRMEARGLVRRTDCAADMRGTWVELTDEGRSAARAALPERLAVMRELFFDVLDAEEQAALLRIATKVLDAGCSSDCADEPAAEHPATAGLSRASR